MVLPSIPPMPSSSLIETVRAKYFNAEQACVRRMGLQQENAIPDLVNSNNLSDNFNSRTMSPSSRSFPPPITSSNTFGSLLDQSSAQTKNALPFEYTGTWQQKCDLYHRFRVMAKVNSIILERARKKNKFWSPSNTRHIEILLYRSGKSLRAYTNPKTLESRLDAIFRCLVKAKSKFRRKRSKTQDSGDVKHKNSTDSVVGSFPFTHESHKTSEMKSNLSPVKSFDACLINFNVNLNLKRSFAA